jgi:uncharacterized membrane protein (GlpM family)
MESLSNPLLGNRHKDRRLRKGFRGHIKAQIAFFVKHIIAPWSKEGANTPQKYSLAPIVTRNLIREEIHDSDNCNVRDKGSIAEIKSGTRWRLLPPSLLLPFASRAIPSKQGLRWMRVILYFILGGAVAALLAYLGGTGRGTLSAFISTLPVFTALTFLIIYSEGGKETVIEYARGLLLFTPAWVCYVLVVLVGLNWLDMYKSLILGFLTYVVIAAITEIL